MIELPNDEDSGGNLIW